MRRARGAVLAGVVSGLISMAWTTAPVQAHALLTASSPADGASVEQPPTEVLLTFTEAPDPALTVVRVLDASGNQLEAGRPEVVAGQPMQLRVPLGSLSEGTYTTTWRTTSSVDGHTTAGSVAFGVGVPAAPASTEGVGAVVESPAPTPAGVAGRWLFYVGAVLMVGAAVVGVRVASDPAAVSGWPLAGAWTAGAGGLLLTVNDQRTTAQTSLGNLLSSSTGHRLTTQAATMAFAGVAAVWACRRPSRSSLAVVGIGASAVMLARALAGHANASSVRWFAVGMQWVHLVAVGAWVGGLFWLLVAMRRGDPGQGRGLAPRFSSVAGLTLALAVVSGTARALDEVGAWAHLVDTSFGVALLVKVGLFSGLVALGARARFRHVPVASPARFPGLRGLVRAEVALAAAVLGATAMLAGFPPSASVAAASKAGPTPTLTVTGSDYATSVRVRLVVTPGTVGPNRFEATVEDYDSGAPVAAEAVSLRFQLAGRPDLSATTLGLTRHPDSGWRGSGTVLSIQGRWTVTALVQTPDDAVEVPMELTARPPGVTTAAGSQGICAQAAADPAYSVVVNSEPDPPTAEGTTFRLIVRRDARSVTKALVCLKADMPDMQHPGVSSTATEAAPGQYETRVMFSMTGTWVGSVIVNEPGKRPVSVPVSFDVT